MDNTLDNRLDAAEREADRIGKELAKIKRALQIARVIIWIKNAYRGAMQDAWTAIAFWFIAWDLFVVILLLIGSMFS